MRAVISLVFLLGSLRGCMTSSVHRNEVARRRVSTETDSKRYSRYFLGAFSYLENHLRRLDSIPKARYRCFFWVGGGKGGYSPLANLQSTVDTFMHVNRL